MQRDREFLLDILEAAKLVVSYVGEKSKEYFLKDIQCQDAVVRRFEIIGEASRRISDDTRDSHPELPWGEMIAMRNVMIHEYGDVDFTVVWETVRDDIPAIISTLESIVPPEEKT